MSNAFCGQCGQPLGVPASAESAPVQTVPSQALGAPELTDQGFQLTRKGDWDGAVKKYEEALRVNPSYALAHSNLGFALNRLAKHDEAIEVLTEGLAMTADPVLTHRMLDARGFAKSKIRDYEGAIVDFSEALKFVATNPRVYYHRAESQTLVNKFNDAYNDVLLALRLDPAFRPAVRLRQRLETEGYVRR